MTGLLSHCQFNKSELQKSEFTFLFSIAKIFVYRHKSSHAEMWIGKLQTNEKSIRMHILGTSQNYIVYLDPWIQSGQILLTTATSGNMQLLVYYSCTATQP